MPFAAPTRGICIGKETREPIFDTEARESEKKTERKEERERESETERERG